MEYRDELEVSGRLFRVEGRTAPVGPADGYDVRIVADDVGTGPIELRASVPAADLTVLGEVTSQVLAGLGRLAGATPAGNDRFRVRVATDRQRHPNAWTAWTPDDAARVLAGYRAGTTVEELAEELGRKPRAVISRLIKHGMVPLGGDSTDVAPE